MEEEEAEVVLVEETETILVVEEVDLTVVAEERVVDVEDVVDQGEELAEDAVEPKEELR